MGHQQSDCNHDIGCGHALATIKPAPVQHHPNMTERFAKNPTNPIF
jgi:hypothetical protein